jgi:hypothetical protein
MLFPNRMLVRINVTTISTPPVCVKPRDAKWPQQGFKFQEDLIRACAKDIGSDLSCAVINRMPQPPLLVFALHKAPHLIHRGSLSLVDDDLHLLSIKLLEKACIMHPKNWTGH